MNAGLVRKKTRGQTQWIKTCTARMLCIVKANLFSSCVNSKANLLGKSSGRVAAGTARFSSSQ